VTTDTLTQYVWDHLGPRKHAAGRARIAELVEMAVSSWPAEVLGECRDEGDRQVVSDASISTLRRRIRQREYGFFWTLLLTSLASAVFQVLLKWWLERRSNRVFMLVMRQETKA
jgi:hypothetical protein